MKPKHPPDELRSRQAAALLLEAPAKHAGPEAALVLVWGRVCSVRTALDDQAATKLVWNSRRSSLKGLKYPH